MALAARVTVPALLLHGAADRKTKPSHSQRIHAPLRGPRRLVLIPGVGHDEILGREEARTEIESFSRRRGLQPPRRAARGGGEPGQRTGFRTPTAFSPPRAVRLGPRLDLLTASGSGQGAVTEMLRTSRTLLFSRLSGMASSPSALAST